MQSKRVWARVLGVETGVVIERVELDEEAGEIVDRMPASQGRPSVLWSLSEALSGL